MPQVWCSPRRPVPAVTEAAILPPMQSVRSTISEMLREVVEFRELLFALVRRDLVLRYRNSLLGFGWAIAMPALYMVVFSVIFTRVAPLETTVPYPIYAYAGLLPWNLFASAQRFAATSLTANPQLVSKVFFPRELLPFGAVVVSFIDFLVATLLLVALMLFYGIGITGAIAFLPLVLVVHLAFTTGVALLVAMANLYYADVKYVMELVLTLWMFGTSVVYPVERVGGTLGAILSLNPMTPIIDAFRSVLVYGSAPSLARLAGAALISFLTLAAGWYAFHRAEFRFAEEV